ncbi:hypothetical protein [Zhouia amylolytica]|uniref:Uncharacterized protein n=1 Tax=Zhouia amylolytica AD3 TaxID=1286632 RepID=W2UN57_9FLAO|nr:hypothetical protein [Zhouia amylolytica]ETN95384.1 hypothetical protein P278_11060 [Zhouia amylolytica AD3]
MAILSRVDVVSKLQNYRDALRSSKLILEEVHAILNKEENRDIRIKSQLDSESEILENNFNFDLLNTESIFHINQIKKICIDYRLRFLSTTYFKGDFPQKTINKIKLIETQHQIQIKGYRIIAPSKLFKLKNADDPLLFAPIGNNYFYLIDKWGKNLHPLRKYLMLPFKNLRNLILLVLLLSLLVTSLLPIRLFTTNPDKATFWLLYMFVFKMIGSIVIFYGFALGKNFNHAIWNSKYFNA